MIEQGQSRMKRFNYAIGMFGTSIPINMFKTYAAIFYVDSLGLTTAQFAAVVFIYTFIDAIDNPVYGYLSDTTRTRWGRRRPWLAIGTPLLILGFIAFYSPPDFLAGNSLFAYCMLIYIFTGTMDSLINANYGALFPELFTTDASRASTNALRQAFQLVAMIISIALTPMVTEAIGFSTTAIIYGLVGGAVILYMTFTSREKAISELGEKPQFWSSLKSLLTNKKFWIASIASAFYSAAMGLVMAGLPFFAKYTLKISSAQQTILFATVLLIAMLAIALWAQLVKRKGLLTTWRWAFLALAISFVPLYFASSLITAIIGSVLVGFGFAGCITTIDLIAARIMDEDTAKHNVRREGLISNAIGFMNRLNGLFVSLAFLLVDRIYGFKSGFDPGLQPDNAARFLLTVFPFVMMVFGLITTQFLHFPAAPLPAQPVIEEV